MKIRSLIVATFVFIVLAGALYWSSHRKPSDDFTKASADAPPAILKLDASAITGLELKKRDAEPVVLAKNGSGSWEITHPKSFPADQSMVSGTLGALSSLNSERIVEDKAADLRSYGLDQPSFEADISEKDGKTQKLLIGDDSPTGGATYAMLAGDPRVYTIASYTKGNIDKSLDDLRDKRLVTIDADKISRLELVRKGQTIEFGRDKDEWQILKPEPLRADSIEVGELVSKLTEARMDLSGSEKDQQEAATAFAHGAPVATAQVTGPSGTQELQVRQSKDAYYAKSSVVAGDYKVDASLGQALDKGLDDFRNKKLFDFGYTDPSKVEIHDGSIAYFLTKGGEDWWSNGKKMDPESAEDLVADVRDLTANNFVESGFSQPTIQIIVTDSDGKTVERVSVAKSSDGFVAQRANESTLYHLDASPIEALEKAAEGLKPAPAKSK
jgi:hypothetical protein